MTRSWLWAGVVLSVLACPKVTYATTVKEFIDSCVVELTRGERSFTEGYCQGFLTAILNDYIDKNSTIDYQRGTVDSCTIPELSRTGGVLRFARDLQNYAKMDDGKSLTVMNYDIIRVVAPAVLNKKYGCTIVRRKSDLLR